MNEGTLSEWLAADGATVTEGQPLFSLESDKSTNEVESRAAPVPTPGQILIHVRAIGVNPADGKWRSGMFQTMVPLQFPYVGGFDVAGEVIGGDGLPIGTRVIAMLDNMLGGAYVEFVVADASRVAVLPSELDFPEGAALPTPGLTGLQAIEEELAVQPGHRLLITGAMGGVGRHALRAAIEAGATIVAAVRPDACDDALNAGAHEAVALDGSAYNGASFDRVLDTVGGEIVVPFLLAVKPDRLAVTVATTPIPSDGLPVAVRFFGVQADAERLARVIQRVANRLFSAPVKEVLPLIEAAAAQARVDDGSAKGKFVLIP